MPSTVLFSPCSGPPTSLHQGATGSLSVHEGPMPIKLIACPMSPGGEGRLKLQSSFWPFIPLLALPHKVHDSCPRTMIRSLVPRICLLTCSSKESEFCACGHPVETRAGSACPCGNVASSCLLKKWARTAHRVIPRGPPCNSAMGSSGQREAARAGSTG